MNEPLKSRIDFQEPIVQDEVNLKKGLIFKRVNNFYLLILD